MSTTSPALTAPTGPAWGTITVGLLSLFAALIGGLALSYVADTFASEFFRGRSILEIFAGLAIAFGAAALAIGAVVWWSTGRQTPTNQAIEDSSV